MPHVPRCAVYMVERGVGVLSARVAHTNSTRQARRLICVLLCCTPIKHTICYVPCCVALCSVSDDLLKSYLDSYTSTPWEALK
jgi:hypothetical protein